MMLTCNLHRELGASKLTEPHAARLGVAPQPIAPAAAWAAIWGAPATCQTYPDLPPPPAHAVHSPPAHRRSPAQVPRRRLGPPRPRALRLALRRGRAGWSG
jgi:hypothetical protein